jgi:hypothetical protein
MVCAVRVLFGLDGMGVEAFARRPEARGGHAHLYCGFGHAVEGITTCLGRRTFIYHVAENRRRGEDCKVHMFHGLDSG